MFFTLKKLPVKFVFFGHINNLKGFIKMELKSSGKFNHEVFGTLTVWRDKDNNCWFMGKEVAEKLGYIRPSDAIKQHCVDTVKHRMKLNQYDTAGNEYVLISEPDLYRLIFSSKLEAAINFQDWVYKEVLTSIRSTGMYATNDIIERMINDKDWGTTLLLEVRNKLDKSYSDKQIKTIPNKQREFASISDFIKA